MEASWIAIKNDRKEWILIQQDVIRVMLITRFILNGFVHPDKIHI